MKKYNEIEDKMKSVSDSESVTPPSFVWDNIETTLDQGKDSRRFLFWFILGVAIVGLGFIGVTKFAYSGVASQQTAELKEEKYYISNENNKALTLKSEETTMIDSALSDKEKIEIEKSSNIQPKQENTNRNSTKQNDNNLKSEFDFKSTKTNKITVDSYQNTEGDLRESLSNTISKLDDGNSTNDQSKDLSNIAENDVMNEKFDFASIGMLELMIENEKRIIPNKEVVCPSFSENFKLDFFVEVSGLTGSQSKKFGLGQSPSLAADRSRTEQSYIGYGASIAGGVYLNNNMYIMTGLDWFNSVDKFNLEREGLTKMIIDYDIDTQQPTDTTFVVGTVQNSGYINYRTIDVPFTFGLRKLSGSWSFGFEAGGILNVAFAAKGKIVTETGEVSTIQNVSNVYKDKLGLGIKSSLVAGRYLGYGLSVQTRLTYKNYLKEVNHIDYNLPTKFQFMRLELGLRKEF